MKIDVAIVGAGPAGLATAIGAALRGLSVHVFEKQAFPVDKACGEGLMPSGLRALERLGALTHLDSRDGAPFDSIRYVQEDGASALGRLPNPGGLGVRRTALSRALLARAQAVGVVLHEKTGVREHRRVGDAMHVVAGEQTFQAKVLVGADGLHSLCRQREGLSLEAASPRRYGLRRHVVLAPWSRSVEVHFSVGVEAYVTPAGAQRVGVAFLWDAQALSERASFESLLHHFPVLEAQLRGCAFDSSARGAGPLLQRVKRRVAPGFALVGDASGYVDAITGEGLTQAFVCAEALSSVLPDAVRQRGALPCFVPYERVAEREFRRYARWAHLLVWLARHATARRVAVNGLQRLPALFDFLLRQVGH